MPAKFNKCIEKLKKEGKEGSEASTICQAAIKDEAIFKVDFSDALIYDEEHKRVTSVRDGVQEYYGYELGIEPAEKKHQVYRDKATIAAIVDQLPGLPITMGHIALEDTIPDGAAIGIIRDSELVDAVDENLKSSVKIMNRVKLNDMPDNRQLSLGYLADLVPCELYDFEQVDIVPHHLAVVERGRCGDICKFTDQKGDSEMHKKYDTAKAFMDAKGQINMQQVFELVAGLQEVVKKLDIKELAKIIPKLQQVTALANEAEAAEGGEEEIPAAAAEGEGEGEGEGDPAAAEAPAASEEIEDKVPTEEEKKKEMMDSSAFKDAVAAAATAEAKLFASTVAKAQDFLDADFDYGNKTAPEIMRAALKTQNTEAFEDSELSTAFKLLKKNVDYSKFGDAKPGTLADLADKEI